MPVHGFKAEPAWCKVRCCTVCALAHSAKIIKAAWPASALAKKTFSLKAMNYVSTETMRDLLFMIAWNTFENKIRIPKPNLVTNQVRMNDRMCMLAENKTFSEVTKPQKMHPYCMFTANGPKEFQPEFASPVASERPHNSTVGA